MNRFLISAVLILSIVSSPYLVSAEEEYCSAEKESCQAAAKSQSKDDRWTVYREKIAKAVQEYQDCGDHCYEQILKDSLAPFKNGITKETIEQTHMYASRHGILYQVIDHKLYRQSACMFSARCEGVEHFLKEIVHEMDDSEFIINVSDPPYIYDNRQSPLPLFSFSRTAQYIDIMYPAWTFWAGGPAVWPIEPTGLGRWDIKRQLLQKSANQYPWEKKIKKAFFRGSRTSSERDPLVLLSRAKPELADAEYTKNQAWKSDKDTLGAPPAKEIKLEDHCNFAYLFNFRGVAASFRHKHLFLCNSLVFHVSEEWLEFYYPEMKPWVHYIPVNQDLSDAEELIKFAQENDDLAKEIAQRGHDFIRQHLKMENITDYWRTLMQNYTKLLKYKPTLNKSLNLVK